MNNRTDPLRTVTEAQGVPVASVTHNRPCAHPSHFGRYRVEKQLGEGSYGRVYLAHDDRLGRSVAIKMPHPKLVSQPGQVEAYLKEARILALLDHPNIVPVHDSGQTDDGLPFMVSKLIEGTDLAAKLQGGRPSFAETAELVAAVAAALHHAHLKGLVHRDIKPSNILIDLTGKPYVADFGVALVEDEPGNGLPFAGTLPYMSPEQARGEGHRLDGRSDIFSLGVVFHELLTGRRPFRGESTAALLEQIARAEVRPPRQADDAIPKEMERVCLKALAKQLSDRYTTAKDMAEDLIEVLANARREAAVVDGTRILTRRDVRPSADPGPNLERPLFRVEVGAHLQPPGEESELFAGVGFFRCRINGLGKPTAPVLCGCASAVLTCRLDGAVSCGTPHFSEVPANADSVVEYGLGDAPSVRFEGVGAQKILEGRAEVDLTVRRTKQGPLRVRLVVDPEWFTCYCPERPKKLDGATRVILDAFLRKLLVPVTKDFELRGGDARTSVS